MHCSRPGLDVVRDRGGRAALRCLLGAALAAAAVVLPAAARAQAPVLATNGSTLQAAPNLVLPGGANQCLARPYIGLSAGQIQFVNTGQSTCMWWSAQYGPTGDVNANTYVPRGAGAVTRVLVRSGDTPAPLAFAIVSSGGGLCCTTKAVSPVFQPAPNQVNAFAVNLPAGSGVGTATGSQYNDILVIQVAGPGSLPINDRGVHGFIFDSPTNQARASFLHPALANGASNTDVGIMDGYEVLLQYDWCGVPMTLANPNPIAPANPTTACLSAGSTTGPVAPPPGAQPAAPIPLAVAARNALVRSNIASLRLRCVLDTTCRGRLTLLPRTAVAARSKSYGTAKYTIKAGKSKTIRVRLSAAGRKALRRKRALRVRVAVTAGTSSWSLNLTLKRR
jgi:hypothetical protein